MLQIESAVIESAFTLVVFLNSFEKGSYVCLSRMSTIVDTYAITDGNRGQRTQNLGLLAISSFLKESLTEMLDLPVQFPLFWNFERNLHPRDFCPEKREQSDRPILLKSSLFRLPHHNKLCLLGS